MGLMRALVGAGIVLLMVACGSDDEPSEGTGPGAGPSGASAASGSTPGGQAPGSTANTNGTTGIVGKSPMLGGCALFPGDNPWNLDVSAAAVSAKSATYSAKMAPKTKLHPDWGTSQEGYGIPFTVGQAGEAAPITWTTSWGPKESDPLPCASGGGNFCYPIPTGATIEAGGDAHLLFLDTRGAPSACTLYELYATKPSGSGYSAANGAIFKLGSNALRPDGWTSADAAGLPILPGLVRFDEVKAGAIEHAIRFTMNETQQAYIHPATHAAGHDDAALPPMGLRVRLKASVTISAPAAGMTVVTALKKYGMILADNGSDWFLSGDQNDGWASVIDDVKKALDQLHGSDFEVVETGSASTSGL
jgi:hypothetical protein